MWNHRPSKIQISGVIACQEDSNGFLRIQLSILCLYWYFVCGSKMRTYKMLRRRMINHGWWSSFAATYCHPSGPAFTPYAIKMWAQCDVETRRAQVTIGNDQCLINPCYNINVCLPQFDHLMVPTNVLRDKQYQIVLGLLKTTTASAYSWGYRYPRSFNVCSGLFTRRLVSSL